MSMILEKEKSKRYPYYTCLICYSIFDLDPEHYGFYKSEFWLKREEQRKWSLKCFIPREPSGSWHNVVRTYEGGR